MDNITIINSVKCDIECNICYEKFTKLTDEQYFKFLEDNKFLLPFTFENDIAGRLYIDRFECLICKNKVICRQCYTSFKNHKFKPDDDYLEDYEYFNDLDENGLTEGIPGEDCPIICPFCKTKDYKIFYEYNNNNKIIPYELLNDIKNKHLKCKNENKYDLKL